MSENEVVSIREYLESIENSAIIFILKNYSGETLDSQVITAGDIKVKSTKTITASFVVDQVLTTKMIPGNYRLFVYIAIPKEEDRVPVRVQDYILDKCLTEQGIKIRVDGELDSPSVGV